MKGKNRKLKWNYKLLKNQREILTKNYLRKLFHFTSFSILGQKLTHTERQQGWAAIFFRILLLVSMVSLPYQMYAIVVNLYLMADFSVSPQFIWILQVYTLGSLLIYLSRRSQGGPYIYFSHLVCIFIKKVVICINNWVFLGRAS